MQDKELNFIIDYTLTKVEKLGEHFTYSKLVASNIHPAIARYISSHIDYLIYLDRKKLLNESAFDYSGSEISKYQNLIAEQIRKRSKVTLQKVIDVITEGIKFNAEFLSKPNETLLNLIFENSDEVTTDEITIRLNYLYYHAYLKDTLNSYIGKIKTLTIKKGRFREILRKIDKVIYGDNDKELIEYALNSMADFYNIGNSDKSKVPIEHVKQLLKEKNMEKYLKNLELSAVQNSSTSIDVNEAYYILFVKEPEKIEVEIEKPEVKKEDISKVEEEKEVELDIEDETNIDPLYDFEENNEQEKHDHKEEHEEKEEPVKENKGKKEVSDAELEFEEKFINDKIELPDDFELSNRVDSIEDMEDEEELLRQKRARKKEIVSFLSNKEMERIVGSIFNDDREDFANTLEIISDSKNYEEATEVLKKVFSSYNVNPYSKEAIAFTNSVSSYFEQN